MKPDKQPAHDVCLLYQKTYPRIRVHGQGLVGDMSAFLPPSVFLALLGLDGFDILGALLV